MAGASRDVAGAHVAEPPPPAVGGGDHDELMTVRATSRLRCQLGGGALMIHTCIIEAGGLRLRDDSHAAHHAGITSALRRCYDAARCGLAARESRRRARWRR